MEPSIVVYFLLSGFPPEVLVDNNDNILCRCVDLIKNIIQGDAKNNLCTRKSTENGHNIENRHRYMLFEALFTIFEATFEKLETKNIVFCMFDDIANYCALLMSKTFTTSTSCKEKSSDMNLFSNYHIIKLVDIFFSYYTSEVTLDAIQAATKRLDKVGKKVGKCGGFVGKFML